MTMTVLLLLVLLCVSIVKCALLISPKSASGGHVCPWGITRQPRHRPTQLLLSANENIALNVARKVKASVVLVKPMGVRNQTARGTGFVVDFGLNNYGKKSKHEKSEDDEERFVYLLTAAHVVLPGMKVEVEFRGVGEFSNKTVCQDATIVGRDPESDLALIRTERMREGDGVPVPASLSIHDHDEPEVGTQAFALGYPLGIRGPAMTSGIVCASADGVRIKTNTTTAYVVTDAAMAGGMSGGPLVDCKGYVLGVNALVRPELRSLGNYAVDASECVEFLSKTALSSAAVEDSNATTGYRVVIYNDPMNSRARVAQVLSDVAMLDSTAAQSTMMDAHTTGRGVVCEFPTRKDADELRNAIQNADILADVEPVILEA